MIRIYFNKIDYLLNLLFIICYQIVR